MLNNYFTLAALLNEQKNYIEGSQIVAAYSRIENILSVMVEKPRGEFRTITVSCQPQMNYLFVSHEQNLRDNKRRGKLTGANVLKEIIGAKIISAHVENEERIIILKISNEQNVPDDAVDQRFLKINLFGTHANVFLIDSAGKILNSFLRRKTEIARTIDLSPENEIISGRCF